MTDDNSTKRVMSASCRSLRVGRGGAGGRLGRAGLRVGGSAGVCWKFAAGFVSSRGRA
jgi:hypothetical protein